MSRRIDIEITSLNGDLATWRAAGAKLPKGVLSSALVPGGPVVGHVYRADVEQFMEGIEVLSVAPPKTASPLDPRNERLELKPSEAKGPDVVVTYASKGRGPRRDGERREGSKRPGDRRDSKAPRERRERSERPAGASADESRARSPRRDTERAARPARDGERTPRPARDGERGTRLPREGAGAARAPRGAHNNGQPPLATTHRNALLATLSPEQLPVAEQLLRGGMPAVRAAVELQNKNASAQGRPTVDPVTIDRIAEELLGRTNLAMWKDRAAGAMSAGRELRLRDLRAVVTSAKTVSLDDESRTQLKELQTALTARLEHLRTQWAERLEAAISARKVREALELVARPPDISTRVSADVATRVI
ncbi:MAG TPA: hypothetical protein PLG60_07440, partial [Acidimicrobiales bacterium]|nr:hypothetical protein [Acidimicrobiales bacterium]